MNIENECTFILLIFHFLASENIKKVRLFLTALLNSELHSNHYATRH